MSAGPTEEVTSHVSSDRVVLKLMMLQQDTALKVSNGRSQNTSWLFPRSVVPCKRLHDMSTANGGKRYALRMVARIIGAYFLDVDLPATDYPRRLTLAAKCHIHSAACHAHQCGYTRALQDINVPLSGARTKPPPHRQHLTEPHELCRSL
ncbi:hypothetical protein Efla_006391 [Eimeria flavescens]